MPAMKQRLDKMLVERHLVPTREKAQALILAGQVRVNGNPATKAGQSVAAEARVEVLGKVHPYVSRGGVKLEAALKGFGIDVAGLSAIDIGASTGGFTHCLLLRGAAHVTAVDVGYGQLAWEVRNDPRVTVLERTNIRELDPAVLTQPVDLAVVDVSFISLAIVLRHAVRFVRPGGRILALVKPQFEAGREQVGRGGRITDSDVHADVLRRVTETGAQLGLDLLGQMESPLAGKKSGNREFLVLWRLRDAAPQSDSGPGLPGPPHPRVP
jgi:23S rRNA (cytidine1920-2'-O)/16S rRNA (cytidine1409-2'-O)-methyltransferase